MTGLSRQRPRVVVDPFGELPRTYYCVRPDFAGRPAIYWSRSSDSGDDRQWSALNFPVCITAERVALWADLLAPAPDPERAR